MGLKSQILYTIAKLTRKRVEARSLSAVADQKKTFDSLIKRAAETQFGRDHGFSGITNSKEFITQVPIRDYEGFRPYIDQIKTGKSDVLWNGRPIYFAKTSGTTSGVKYIPITKESIPNHIGNARDGLFNQVARKKLTNLFDGKMIFLSGSPVLEKQHGIQTGRLSGIVNHWIPSWLKQNQLPSYSTNCIDDWEQKVDKIAHETIHANMTLISGIPPWVQMYYERLLEMSGKTTIQEIFPQYQLFVYGGVQYEPYRLQLEKLVGRSISSLETFPASEGFFAFQDLDHAGDGLLLSTASGIYFEFIPLSEKQSDKPISLSLHEVETGVSYALIISSNAGLWRYDVGDVIEFVSLNPYRVKVTGRVKHFISAFGEHVIGKEVEEALAETLKTNPALITEFTVAPQVNPEHGQKPYHEWFIECSEPPGDEAEFARKLDQAMVDRNIYYRDLIEGKILQPLRIRFLPPGTFKRYMQSIGKLGGQNKVARLSNDRTLADGLIAFSSAG